VERNSYEKTFRDRGFGFKMDLLKRKYNFPEDVEVFEDHLKLKVSGLQYGNIEIRPKGIILHINKGVYTYAWTIPYFRLSIYNGDFFTLHGNGNYIQFNKEKSWKENRNFLQKLIQLKSNYNPLL